MPKLISVGAVCDNLAALARERGQRQLSNWLKLAGNEAYLNEITIEADADRRIGIFDWDVANNLNYLNPVGAAFFGKGESFASVGAPNEAYMCAVHSDDVEPVLRALDLSIRQGGAFCAEYRVVNEGRIRWLRADGHCSVDQSGRPVRLIGSMIDITQERLVTSVML
jgi:PAS domain-containing protein